MAAADKLPGPNARAIVVLWIAAVLVGAFVILWPVWAGIVATNDDIKFLREPSCALPVWDRVCDAWTHSASFRPLEIIVSASCDATTLACGLVMPVQALALVVLAWAVVGLADRVAPGNRAVAPIALLWIDFHRPPRPPHGRWMRHRRRGVRRLARGACSLRGAHVLRHAWGVTTGLRCCG